MPEPLSDRVMYFVRQGRHIGAIKQLREETGLGLKEAKHVIDEAVRQYRISNPNHEMQDNESKWPIIFLLLMAAAGYFWFTQGG